MVMTAAQRAEREDRRVRSLVPDDPRVRQFQLPDDYWSVGANDEPILEQLQRNPEHWAYAGNATTNVVPPAGAPPAAAVVAPAPAAATTAAAGQKARVNPAAPPPTTQQTAQDAIDNVQTTLDKQNKAIQQAVQSGLIDISTAHNMWEEQRKKIYGDFVNQYGGITDQYGSEEERLKADRTAERQRLLAQMDSRGVDASMVGDELGILDALVASQADANVGYMADTRDIAAMADTDRQFLGEGIFGGYTQDLRSGARGLMLDAGLGAASAEGTRLDEALAANALAGRFGESPAALMGGFVGGVDLPSMSWQTGERLGSQDWQSLEKELDRKFTTSEREAIELWRTSERVASQDWQTLERTGTQTWQSGEAGLDRKAAGIDPNTGRPYGFDTTSGLTAGQQQQGSQFDISQRIDPLTGLPYGFDIVSGLSAAEQEQQAQFEALQQAQGIDPDTGLPYGFNTASGLTAAQGLGQQNFMLGLAGQGIDTRQTITQQTPWGPMQVANPAYGRPIGFDAETGLTAGQTQDQSNWDALFEQGGDQFAAGQLAAGIDTRQTIFEPDPQTGYMRPVQNPNYGRPMGFDAATGLTAGETADQTYRDALLAADETAATQTQSNLDRAYDASMMGVDEREYVPGPETGAGGQNIMIRNPTYGMTPAQQSDYAMDLFAMTQPSEVEVDTFSNLMQILGEGSLFNPQMSTDVLTQISQVIDSSTGMATKGMTSDNVLFALGQLANTPGEKVDGKVTYPYRELFIQVQRANQEDPAGDAGTTGGGGATAAGGATGGGGAADSPNLGPPGFGPDVGQSEAELSYAETPSENIATGERLQGTRMQTREAGARGGAAQNDVYADINDERFTQAEVDAIAANIPSGFSPDDDNQYEPGVLGYIDYVARIGWVFDENGKAGPVPAAATALHPSKR